MGESDTLQTGSRRFETRKHPPSKIGYDMAIPALNSWFVGGLFLDGWAHNHIPELESFFTPWHAVFYTGFLAVAGFLVATLVRNHANGYPWQLRHAARL